jgi:hypothetical protein|tara:strand:- start:2455 stop:3063 length:609 start_codon:yes stop_codon:yes gene_type:complete
MTQSEAGERKRTLVAVRSAESAPGQYGPQWALIVAYPWMRAGRTAKAWIPRDEFAPAPEPGQYSCLVEKGSKWATDSPGDEDWQYNWRLIGGLSGVEDADPTDATPTAPKPIAPLPDRDPTQDSIERQTALKVAGKLIVAEIGAGLKHDENSGPRSSILDYAQVLYNWLSESPETPQEPRPEEKPAQRPEDMMDGTDEPFPV